MPVDGYDMPKQNTEPQPVHFVASGPVPNSDLPVLIHRTGPPDNAADPAAFFERLFERNGWSNGWRNGVYPFHHYHSTSHEVLGVACGRAKLRLGGEDGRDLDVATGDVLVLPAGTGHKRLSASPDFLVVGAYPEGRGYDLIRADETSEAETRAALRNIARVPLPDRDPVSGKAIAAWRATRAVGS